VFYHFVIPYHEGFEWVLKSMNGPEEKRRVEKDRESSNEVKPSYYYDDAHGYEEYDPKKDREDEDEDEDELDD